MRTSITALDSSTYPQISAASHGLPRSRQLSTRGAYEVLKDIAEDANLTVSRDADFTPHVPRHTAATTMIRDGEDIVVVAEILGHSVETARRYSLPTEQDKQRAIGRLPVDQ